MSDSAALPRLSKLMAERGLCSRREADSYIERGWVKVDGEVATLGLRVSRTPASSCWPRRAAPSKSG